MKYKLMSVCRDSDNRWSEVTIQHSDDMGELQRKAFDLKAGDPLVKNVASLRIEENKP